MSQKSSIILDGPRPTPPSIWWRGGKLLLGALSIALFSYYLRLFSGAPERLRSACANIEVGMSHAEVHTLAVARGLRPPAPGQEVTFLGEVATRGRHGCRVEWHVGRVLRSAYEPAN